jgi:CBS domain-containing protein
MRTVKEILERKGSEVFSISYDQTVFDAVAEMDRKNVGALVVMRGEAGKQEVCGIISERDYLRHIVLKGRTSRKTPVHEIMSRKVIYALPGYTMDQALNVMLEKRIRHLPIMDENRLAGIISMGDCVRETIRSQEVQINYLKEFIADGYPGPAGNSD